MEIKVTKLTDVDLMRKACAFTINAKESKMSLKSIYKCEHSPIRTQLFWIEMYDIPTFVSVHLVRHNIGITHFVKSNREDRPGFTGDLGREQPVNHAILLNAEAILNIAHKRYCTTTHVKTKEVIQKWEDEIRKIDPDLADQMMPWCQYRGGICPELKPCGYNKKFQAKDSINDLLKAFCDKWALNFHLDYWDANNTFDIHIHGAGKNEDWYYDNMSANGWIDAMLKFLLEIESTFKCES